MLICLSYAILCHEFRSNHITFFFYSKVYTFSFYLPISESCRFWAFWFISVFRLYAIFTRSLILFRIYFILFLKLVIFHCKVICLYLFIILCHKTFGIYQNLNLIIRKLSLKRFGN